MSAAARIEPNSFVELECSLRDEEGEPIDGDESDDAVEYVHGYGMLVPGLETALTGLVAGDQKEIFVPPASGYGERDEDLVMEVDRSDFPEPDELEAGDEFVADFPDGDNQTMRVVEVLPDSVIVDANHPLAGMSLRYFVKVRLVRPATEEEIEQAARELSEAEDEAQACGPSCSHEHEGAHDFGSRDVADLITLGRKKSAPN
jgi:FKBP-type peptidyl-prolyl cis-trans isomerase SlyD